jgi:hypothetical protein
MIAALPGVECAESSMSKLKIAKSFFLTAAGISFLLSVGLWFSGEKEQGQFVGLWVPTILALGAMMLAGRESR